MSFWQFLVLLPKLIESLMKLFSLVKEHNLEEWLKDLDSAINKAEVASDSKTRREAAIDIANVISRL